MSSLTIATIKEIKNNENRIALTPVGAKKLKDLGHRVLVQTHAGEGAGFEDSEYIEAGAEMMETPEEIARTADLLLKVKEPLAQEYSLLAEFQGKTLFTYLHLSGVDPALTEELLKNNITGIAYETVKDERDGLPLLAPMSYIAGVLAVQYGGEYLQKKYKGVGITLGEIPGTLRAKVMIVGGGVVGSTAAKAALGIGSEVTLFDIKDEVLERLKNEFLKEFQPHVLERLHLHKPKTEIFSNTIKETDLLIGAVLVPGAKAPRVVQEEDIKTMKKGSVVIDVAIDQGGCVWGAKATTHSEPIYYIDDKIFCCVANMPGQVAKQSTEALTAATLPYIEKIAQQGVIEALKNDRYFQEGLNTYQGKITLKSVAEDLNREGDYAEFS